MNLQEHQKEHQKRGWDNDAGIYHCSDGPHFSWWQAIVRTPEWKAWYTYASKNMLYDVDECQECGWMSEGHARDFMAFVRKQGREDLLDEMNHEERKLLDGFAHNECEKCQKGK